jgi:nucleotide-binding universal stress UspA family protein
MDVLSPIDGSDCSFRALEFAVEFADRFGASLHVVHFSEGADDSATEIFDRANALLAEHDVVVDPELVTGVGLSEPGYADNVGKDILRLVEERGYDHVVMGHHGTDAIGRIILGSASETVLRASEVPATMVP